MLQIWPDIFPKSLICRNSKFRVLASELNQSQSLETFRLIINLWSFCFQYTSTTLPEADLNLCQKKHQPKRKTGGLPTECCLWCSSSSTDEFRAKVQEPHPLIFGLSPNSGPPLRSPQNFGENESCRELENHGATVFSPQFGSKIREVTYLRDTSWSLEPLQSRRWLKFTPKEVVENLFKLIQTMKFESESLSHIVYVNVNLQRT